MSYFVFCLKRRTFIYLGTNYNEEMSEWASDGLVMHTPGGQGQGTVGLCQLPGSGYSCPGPSSFTFLVTNWTLLCFGGLKKSKVFSSSEGSSLQGSVMWGLTSFVILLCPGDPTSIGPLL